MLVFQGVYFLPYTRTLKAPENKAESPKAQSRENGSMGRRQSPKVFSGVIPLTFGVNTGAQWIPFRLKKHTTYNT